ncbi:MULTISPECIES: hypothetical protein [Streptomyces]|uniref:hypothetical protein n=1 Tax=Streptomyces scabiei TaxID=1930 RepID=UPI001B300907|nr:MULTISPECIES: hypothetical protein [Streptomyces]MBP5868419.1 hypothetical protein [Streptomyces sp. LBUM 1485]MBP5892482.1 hypothetical protein [Streptomyces sp. LBUM 1481]MBP5915660.1 hypothetical protein [Streptomyces sp. LBUM 1486]MBP5922716.1 hypothetical protein [Streptomyces sp. LBUM 1483]MDX2691634.1 hypothetical protein [Streptomyces scabiei]
MSIPGEPRGDGCGWSSGAVFGRADAPLREIIVHWFNLPKWRGQIDLMARTDGSRTNWSGGRWVHETGGWRMTLDVRPDHSRVWSDLHKKNVYVMTHVMELRRVDGDPFTAAEAEPVLKALHIGVSFALGRWAAPMLPVGKGINGEVVWERWEASHCDPARSISPGWWYVQQHSSLAQLLDHLISEFTDPNSLAKLRLQMMHAIPATSDRGFVEQRITMGVMGLEHLMWQVLVLGNTLTERQYRGWDRYCGKKLSGNDLLRMTLTAAKIPVDPVDWNSFPGMARFLGVKKKRRRGRRVRPDGADAVMTVRNSLVHPKGGQEKVYQADGLLTEAWLLTRHYLVLLILNSIGYRGSYRDLRKASGSASDVGSVPWL